MQVYVLSYVAATEDEETTLGVFSSMDVLLERLPNVQWTTHEFTGGWEATAADEYNPGGMYVLARFEVDKSVWL